jgi:hypothetical protein
MKQNLIVLIAAICFVIVSMAGAADQSGQVVNIDGKGDGRVYEGIGVCSAGASSKLLMDYKEPYRSEILDLLFKSMYGASIDHLKVEIGSGTNSTDGTEPSHARTRDELENPKEEYYQRGYEWWLMKEAKKRNKDLILDILAWGAPAWIGNGNYYSQDNADYFVAFIKGAKKYHGLDIDYAGIWNEMDYNAEWIKLYRRTLDAAGLEDVKISAADIVNGWHIVDDMNKDKELYDAIDVVAIHYPYFNNFHSTDAAKNCGKRLWSGEDGSWASNWGSSMTLAGIYNRNYIIGKMVKTVIWAPITSFYNNLPYNDPGLMRGNKPWSGHYELRPAFWVTAHTTQFARIGWQYLDSGCGMLEKGGSFVTMKEPGRKGNYSIIIETSDATDAQKVTFKLQGGLSKKKLALWRTNEESYFIRQADIKPKNNTFTIELDPGAVYSLTTTRGQNKPKAGPKDSPFPFPYSDNFDKYKTGKLPLYFLDQGGVFEVTKHQDGKGNVLRQMLTEESKMRHWLCPSPETIIGDIKWKDYEVCSDVYIEDAGYVAIFGRLGAIPEHSSPRNAYRLSVDQDGNWQLVVAGGILTEGTTEFSANTWHNLKLKFYKQYIIAEIDGKEVTSVHDGTFSRGMVAQGSGWNHARFDNFIVQEFTGEKPKPKPGDKNLALGKKVSVSSIWSEKYDADMVIDDDYSTRWNSAPGKTTGEWFEIDFGKDTTFDKVVLRQYEDRITAYKIQAWNGSGWIDLYTGDRLGVAMKIITFPATTSSKLRFYVVSTNGETASLWEMKVHNTQKAASAKTDFPEIDNETKKTLVNSQPELLEFFLDTFEKLPKGKVTGISCDNGIEIKELQWDMATGVVNAILTSAETQKITLRYPKEIDSIKVTKGGGGLGKSPLGAKYWQLSMPAGDTITLNVALR